MLDLRKPMHQLHWKILARLQGTSKLKMGPATDGRQVKGKLSKKKRGKKTRQTNRA